MQRWFSACRMCLKKWRAKTEWSGAVFGLPALSAFCVSERISEINFCFPENSLLTSGVVASMIKITTNYKIVDIKQ